MSISLICSSTSEIVPKDKLPPIVTLPLISASLVTVIADKSVAPRMIFSTSFVTAFRLLSTLSVNVVKLLDTSDTPALFCMSCDNSFNDASTLSVNVNKLLETSIVCVLMSSTVLDKAVKVVVKLVKLDDTSIVCALISSIVALFSVNVINVFNDASTLSVNVNKLVDTSTV